MSSSDSVLCTDAARNDGSSIDETTHPTSLSARLVDDNRDLLEKACTARFMNEINSGTLSGSTFRTYLAIERHFVVESARLLAAAALRSPSEESLIEHVYAAHHLLHDQLRYFSETLRSVGDASPASQAALDMAGALAALARESIAADDYWRPIVLSYATEHMYLKWCEAALAAVDSTTEVGRWVTMHTTAAFRGRVEYLASEVDRATPNAVADQANRLYRDAIEAEIRFHDAPYVDQSTSHNTNKHSEGGPA